MKELDDSYEALVADARRRVEKSGERVSDDQAVARFLRTPKGHAAYARWIEGRNRVAATVRKADEERALREYREGVADRFVEQVEKCVAAGMDRDDAIVQLFDENIARALGLDVVLKAADEDAYAPIERAAAAILKRRPGLSHAQAVNDALRQKPELYDQYVQKMGRLQYEATNPALNTGDGLGGGGELFGSTAGEDEPPARQRGEDLDTGAAFVTKDEHELWSEIVAKSGASETDPDFARIVDGFLSTADGQRLYRDYVCAYEARDANEQKGTR